MAIIRSPKNRNPPTYQMRIFLDQRQVHGFNYRPLAIKELGSASPLAFCKICERMFPSSTTGIPLRARLDIHFIIHTGVHDDTYSSPTGSTRTPHDGNPPTYQIRIFIDQSKLQGFDYRRYASKEIVTASRAAFCKICERDFAEAHTAFPLRMRLEIEFIVHDGILDG